ncbi:UvrD-helicase domain-containing protein [Ruegeria marina]|uniref:DNA 3'-5' helicase n=1 Tax=Ruegeria marina TaxID=639004 RepID=A0A1G7D9K6_9RHOB|nr:UvrD-helicase domain-containing protein [Ruegeria marina]SDE48304.1 UvrD-like helicase C-terminal domain-containing protein [Ruegeria marina]
MSTLNPVVAIGDDILDCLSRLPKGAYQKAAKFIMRFRSDPRSSGINYERIQNAKDDNLRSVRIDQNLRGIVLAPEKGNVYVLLWIDNHDDAYKWAVNRMARVNVASGSLQVFSVDEKSVKAEPKKEEAKPGLFDDLRDRELVRLGVPEELLSVVRKINSEADLETAEDSLPPDAYEGLYLKAAGYSYEEVMAELDRKDEDSGVASDDFETALQTDESKRKYWVADDEEELQRMLDAPLEKWRVFLHPSQRKLVERDWNGPVRVLGGAGTGKTVAAMHRARWLAEHRLTRPADRILFTTFTSNLAADIQENLRAICETDQLQRIEVVHLDAWVSAFLRSHGESRSIVFPGSNEKLDGFWTEAVTNYGSELGLETKFFQDEWSAVVQANGVSNRDQYLRAPRIGRGTRLDRKKKADIWKVFEAYRARLDEEGYLEPDDAYRLAREILESRPSTLPYKSVVVDEAQDMGPEAFRLIRALIPEAEDHPDTNSMFIVGDGHQRIYGRRVVLGRCGINIRGRSRKLRVNYRTSEEIRKWAVSILAGVPIDDLDDGADDERGYRSLFHGPAPEIANTKNQANEFERLGAWVGELENEGFSPKDICIIARDKRTLRLFENHLRSEEIATVEIKRRQAEDRRRQGIRLATMHRAKGLEFMAVALVAMNDGVVPNVLAIRAAPDEAGREEVIDAERMLVYVAATRAKKRLLVTSSGKPSEIIDFEGAK